MKTTPRPITTITGKPLDYAVCLARQEEFQYGMPDTEWASTPECRTDLWRRPRNGAWQCVRCLGLPAYSSDWSVGGPVLEEENISVVREGNVFGAYADARHCGPDGQLESLQSHGYAEGDTYLVAAMRAIVTSWVYGADVIDIPEDIL